MLAHLKAFLISLHKAKESILAFTCGDIMLFLHMGIPPQALNTIILAILGGIGGMLGKDLYVWGRDWTKRKLNKAPKPKADDTPLP